MDRFGRNLKLGDRVYIVLYVRRHRLYLSTPKTIECVQSSLFSPEVLYLLNNRKYYAGSDLVKSDSIVDSEVRYVYRGF